MSKYYKALKADKKEFKDYYLKSINKTEQQKFLEFLLANNEKSELVNIADLACGAGTLSYHLSNIYKNAKFSMIDFNDDAINLAKDICIGENYSFSVGDITKLDFEDNSFDGVFCWMTLLLFDKDILIKVLDEVIRILKPGQRAYLSSLFNLDYDVDIYSKIYDYTRESTQKDCFFNYNTYSKKTISNILKDKVSKFELVKFSPTIDIDCESRGIGTSTSKLITGERLQISGGLLMNWGILVIEK